MLTAIIVVFVLGYLSIALENFLKINKAAIALVTGVLCWTLYIISQNDKALVTSELIEHMGNLSQILFFLLGAMTIVELIDAHEGFEIITRRITTRNKRKLIWIICLLAFFLSAVLDNLTTTIVMISLVRKLITSREDRLLFSGAIIIAANAGGAWSPIGDVTTTMLWIGGQITAVNIILKLILPSLACLVLPVFIFQFKLKGEVQPSVEENVADEKEALSERHKTIVFWAGLAALLFVPVFKTLTHLPPFMGILLALGMLWVLVEILHSEKTRLIEKHTLWLMPYAK